MDAAHQRSKILTAFNSLQDNELDFNSLALELYEYQKEYNPIYNNYLKTIGRLHQNVTSYSEISALPIQFFKSHDVRTGGDWEVEKVFLSSGTGGLRSKHSMRNVSFYLNHAERLFAERIGPVGEYCFLGLLPGYLEREGSSLIEMVNHFISKSNYEQSGFYLNEFEEMEKQLQDLNRKNIPTILFGVSFALLDFLERYQPDLSRVIIIETGGMKGRGKSMSKLEILKRLQTSSNALNIYSEYGMTELLSQAYALDGLRFKESRSLRVVLTELNDPFELATKGKAGQVNAIDLANIDTCAFIQTQDLGRRIDDEHFEILGRIEVSDQRGCNLLLDELPIDRRREGKIKK